MTLHIRPTSVICVCQRGLSTRLREKCLRDHPPRGPCVGSGRPSRRVLPPAEVAMRPCDVRYGCIASMSAATGLSSRRYLGHRLDAQQAERRAPETRGGEQGELRKIDNEKGQPHVSRHGRARSSPGRTFSRASVCASASVSCSHRVSGGGTSGVRTSMRPRATARPPPAITRVAAAAAARLIAAAWLQTRRGARREARGRRSTCRGKSRRALPQRVSAWEGWAEVIEGRAERAA